MYIQKFFLSALVLAFVGISCHTSPIKLSTQKHKDTGHPVLIPVDHPDFEKCDLNHEDHCPLRTITFQTIDSRIQGLQTQTSTGKLICSTILDGQSISVTFDINIPASPQVSTRSVQFHAKEGANVNCISKDSSSLAYGHVLNISSAVFYPAPPFEMYPCPLGKSIYQKPPNNEAVLCFLNQWCGISPFSFNLNKAEYTFFCQ